jgi:hypothetical protein
MARSQLSRPATAVRPACNGETEGSEPGAEAPDVAPPAGGVAGEGVAEPESVGDEVGDVVGVGVGVLKAGGDVAGVGEGDTEGDAAGEAGTVPDGDATGDCDAVGEDDGDAVGASGAEHCGTGRVRIGNTSAPSDGPCAGEASLVETMPVTVELTEAAASATAGLHCGWRMLSGGGKSFAVLLAPREFCPSPVAVPVPAGVPPSSLFPPLLCPVSTVEPTCTIACRSGGTAMLTQARNTMPTSTIARLTVVSRKKFPRNTSCPRRT